MFESIRNDLVYFNNCSNLGLRLDKLNKEIDDPGLQEHDAKDSALLAMESFKFNDSAKQVYSYSFSEWRRIMQSQKDTECFEIKSLTKVLLGTGNASVFEFGFNLSKPHGVPYISGSSLKGLVSSYLEKKGDDSWWKSNQNTEKSAYQVQLFGGHLEDKDYIGSVHFYDAKLFPGSQNWFVKDIITTHYQKYYGDATNDRLPDGTENPIPIKMTALDAGLKFFVVLQGEESERKFIKQVLLEALENYGIGGKTAVGYGRFAYIESEEEKFEKIKKYSIEELKALPTGDALGSNKEYDNAVRYALEYNEISEKLDNKYKKYCPLRYIRLQIEKTDNPSIELLKLEKALKKNLKNYPHPEKNEDGKFIFNYALKHFNISTEDIKKYPLLEKCSYTWEDEITEDNILDIIIDLESRVCPTPDALKTWLENSDLSNKSEAL